MHLVSSGPKAGDEWVSLGKGRTKWQGAPVLTEALPLFSNFSRVRQ